MAINETIITRQILNNWQRQLLNFWWFKIPDPTLGGDVTNERAVDVIACYKGRFIGIEFKLKKNDRAIPIKRIRDGQIRTLCEIEIAGGVGLLAIVVYKGPRDKCLYLIPIRRWNEAVAKTTNRKSIRIEETFPDCRVEPHRVGSYVHWDITPIKRSLDVTEN